MCFEEAITNLRGVELLKYIMQVGERIRLHKITLNIFIGNNKNEKTIVTRENRIFDSDYDSLHNTKASKDYEIFTVLDANFNPKTKFIELVVERHLPGIPRAFKDKLECKCSGIKYPDSNNKKNTHIGV